MRLILGNRLARQQYGLGPLIVGTRMLLAFRPMLRSGLGPMFMSGLRTAFKLRAAFNLLLIAIFMPRFALLFCSSFSRRLIATALAGPAIAKAVPAASSPAAAPAPPARAFTLRFLLAGVFHRTRFCPRFFRGLCLILPGGNYLFCPNRLPPPFPPPPFITVLP